MINGWVSNKNTSPSKCVGRGENNFHTQCTNKLGCACDKLEIGPQKKLSNLLQGSYSCSTGSCMRRKRSGMPGGTFRTLVRGRRRRQNVKGDDSPSTSLKLEIVEEPSVHQPHPGDDQRHVHH